MASTAIEARLVTVLKTQCPRVLPDFAPFDTGRPYVFYQFVGGVPLRYLDNTSNAKQQAVQIEVWADSRLACNDLMRAIEAVICAATTFKGAPRGELITDADAEFERYGAKQDFSLFWIP